MVANSQAPEKATRLLIEAEAARLVSAHAASDDPDSQRIVTEWISQGPYHAVAFAIARDAWTKSERLRIRLADSDPPEMGETGNTPPLSDKDDGDWEAAPSRRRFVGTGLAAASVALAAIGVSRYRMGGASRIETAFGKREVARLDDGSSVSINGGSAIDYKMTGKLRQVRLLRGEALFDVKRDEKRPFVVDAGGTQIRVLGTKFNVRRKTDLIELTVTEGRVAVSAPGTEPATLEAGEIAFIRPGIVTTVSKDPGIVRQRVAWSEGFLEFDGDTLGEVVGEFNRYRESPIVIGDPRITGTLITGRFEIEKSDEFVVALRQGFDIEARPGSNGAIVLIGPQR